MTAKSTLLGWIAEEKLSQVLQGLLGLAEKYKDDELLRDATFQSGRLKALEKKRLDGILSSEEGNLETAKIRQALLHIVQVIPDDWVSEGMENQSATPVVPTKTNWKKYAAYIAAAIALLAGIAEFSGYSLRDIFGKKEKIEQSIIPSPPAPKASTQGDQSPAIITHDGDVDIQYGEPKPKPDSTNNSNTPK
ncbi:MAG: hypothetical protein SF053_10205 [Bacteroidia bacterium]|nr:hypothetical protein [Bacteroidia bacterium]